MGQLGTFMGQQLTAAQTQIMSDTERLVADRVATAVAELVDSAPETLDTLRELAQALQEQGGNFQQFADVILQRISRIENDLANGGGGVGEHTHPDATQTASGFMPATDKVKLDNLGDFADFMAGWNNTPDDPVYGVDY